MSLCRARTRARVAPQRHETSRPAGRPIPAAPVRESPAKIPSDSRPLLSPVTTSMDLACAQGTLPCVTSFILSLFAGLELELELVARVV